MRALTVALICLLALAGAAHAGTPRTTDRIDHLQQELDSLTEDVEDLREPVAEFELFDECAYPIGVSQHGGRHGSGYVYHHGGRTTRRPALAFDMQGFGRPQFHLLAVPGDEPPSIECNEDAGQEDIDD
jgi:hypothetical protein